jgi:hypothetical protein
MIDEARNVAVKFGKESKVEIVQECASDVARKLPGKDLPTYLNVREELVVASGLF